MASQYADSLAQIYEKQGQRETAFTWQKQARLVRVGEPLNRVVLSVNDRRYELDEMHRLKNQRVQFLFQRNRLSLRPALQLIHEGEKLGNQNRFDEALTAFGDATKADPFEPQARYLEALTLVHLRRYDEAIESYQVTERLAPGWFYCRTDLWLAQQLTQGKISHEVFELLRQVEDSSAPPTEKVRLAEQALIKAPKLAPLYLAQGKALIALGRSNAAEVACRRGLSCADELDVQTRLLLNLGITVQTPNEKQQLLEQAQKLNGNIIAGAMAAFALVH